LLPGHGEPRDKRQWNEEHKGIGANVEAALHYSIVLESGTLRVRWWHSPVAIKWSAGSKEGDFCCAPANGDVYCEIPHKLLDCETESQARIHDKHASLDSINHVEHCLLQIMLFFDC
jgi:hypothetical protein